MHTPRIYYPGELNENTIVSLDESKSHHLLNVFRTSIGSHVILFNGNRREYFGTLHAISQKRADIQIHSVTPCRTESPVYIELGQGISRGERMDFAIQKSVELGVAELTPLFTEQCTVKLSGSRLEKRLQHWRAIIIGTCEQTGRCEIPKLNNPMRLENWIQQKREGQRFICDTDATMRINEYPNHSKKVTLLIGPEGGLNDNEIQAAKREAFQQLSLGPRILRTETAPVVALALIQNHYGDC